MHREDDDILQIFTPARPKEWSVQRRWVRLRTDLRVKLHMRINGETTFIFGMCNDISEGGMACYIPADLHVHDRVDIEVVLPYGRRPIVVTAEVRNRNSFRYGFEFVGIQDADRPELVKTVTALSAAN
jgi:c-di-GMP-binding flagellar brake protein YcgR